MSVDTDTRIETPFGVLKIAVYPSSHRPQVSIELESDAGQECRVERMELLDRSLEIVLEGKWS